MEKRAYKSKYDIKDLKIIYLLNQNARLSSSKIAKLVEVSREVAEYRIKKLVKKKAIKSFTTHISLARLGFQSYTFLLKFERSAMEDEIKLFDFLSSHSLVRYVTKCRGNWDVNVAFVCKNRLQLSLFVDELRQFSSMLGDEIMLLPIKPIKFEDYWFLSHLDYEFNEPRILLNPKIDVIDEKLLTIIANNARASLRKLSHHINLSADATNKRFNKLIAMGLIRRFKANLNTEMFGLQEYEIYLKIEDYSQKEELKLRNFFKEQKKIVRVSRIVGNYDIAITIWCKDLNEFELELENARNLFERRIKNYIFALIVKEFKRTPCPNGVFEITANH